MVRVRELQLRPATPEDVPVLQALAGEIWRAYYPGIITPAQIDYMLTRMYAPELIRSELASGVFWALAQAEGRPVGFISFGFEATRRDLKLHKLYLLPELHGRGLGRQMLEYVRAEAARLGATRIHLQVNKRNERALRAYARAGFRVADAVVADIGGGFVMDDFILLLELEGASSAAGNA